MHETEEPLQILKLVFGKRNGQLGIQAALPLPLRPKIEGSSDFFAVKDAVIGKQPDHIMTVLSSLGQSIVPIVAMVPGENALRCLGTGFFVSKSGLLITAAHVIADPIEREYGDVRTVDGLGWDTSRLGLGVLVATNPIFQTPGWLFRKIEWSGLLATYPENPLPFGHRYLKLTADTAICKVEEALPDLLYQPLAIIQPGIRGVGLQVGKGAIAIGYGAMADFAFDDRQDGDLASNGDFSLHLTQGKIIERFPENDIEQLVPTPGPCFSASLTLPGGMSGSPIFDDERIYVHGIVSRGLEDEHGPTAFGYGSMLAPSLSLPLKFMGEKSLIDLMANSEHGIPRLRIPDA
jgi:hypothetical protein